MFYPSIPVDQVCWCCRW